MHGFLNVTIKDKIKLNVKSRSCTYINFAILSDEDNITQLGQVT